MSIQVESPEKKKRKTKDSSPLSFSSLPNEITIYCLARIPRPYYPRLSIVSKSFHSFLSSTDLYIARSQLGFTEHCLYVCLTDHNHQFPQWFRLWVNPNTTLPSSSVTKKENIGRLVPIPPSNIPALENSTVVVGYEIYVIGGRAPSSAVRVLNCLTNTWRDAPSMNVARENASSCFYDGKIYVFGGCKEYESWAEVFDTKNQTWEGLPNPRTDIHPFCVVRTAEVGGKVYVACANNMYTYDLKQGNWEFCEDHMSAMFPRSECVIENVSYQCGFRTSNRPLSIRWCDIEDGIWKDVKGLDTIGRNYWRYVSMTKLVRCGGKLVFIWQEHVPDKKMFWCAEIAVEKRDGGEVWGSIEWADVVHTVPNTRHLLHCLIVSI